jgi:hypothetical protein
MAYVDKDQNGTDLGHGTGSERLGADLATRANPVPALMLIRADPVPDPQHCYINLQQDLITNSCLYLYRIYLNCCLQYMYLKTGSLITPLNCNRPGDHYAESI